MIAPPVAGAKVLAGIDLVAAAEDVPRSRLRGAGQDDAARRFTIGLDAGGEQADFVADGIWRELQQRLQGPVAVAEIGAGGRAIGLAGSEAGEAAVLVL